MTTAVWKLELQLLLRSKLLLLALLVFGIVAIWSVENGRRWYQYQQTATDSLAAATVANYNQVAAELDTLKPAAERTDLETPFTLDRRLKPVLSKPLSPLAALTVGQADVLPLHKSVRMTQPIFNNDFDEFRNPMLLLAGSFDLGFFVLFLFPLLFIGLSYNLMSAEREQGIDRLWLVATRRQLQSALFSRLLFRWVVAWLPLSVAVGYAYGWMQDRLVPASQLGTWVLAAVLYTGMWLSLGWLILSRGWSSMQNLVALLASWLLLLVVVPGLFNTVQEARDNGDTAVAIAEFRDVPGKAWNAPLDSHQRITAQRYPAYAKDTASIAKQAIMRSYGYLYMTMQQEQALHQQLSQRILEQADQQAAAFWVNPAAATLRIFSQIARTTAVQQIAFEQQVLKYKQQRFEHMWDNMILDSHYTRQHLQQMPGAPTVRLAAGHQPWGPLLLWLALPALLAALLSRRQQNA
jgi:ABC-2 type transport system permease protein